MRADNSAAIELVYLVMFSFSLLLPAAVVPDEEEEEEQQQMLLEND